MKTVYLSLGSNQGERQQNLEAALVHLHRPDFRLTRVSSVFETEPRGLLDQPWFLNIAAEARTSLFPLQLLRRIQQIEQDLGRRRIVPNGPRTIDIDILFFGRSQIQTPDLEVPHPRMAERHFVLAPMVEIAPEFRHPASRRTMRELLAGVAGQKIRPTGAVLALPALDPVR